MKLTPRERRVALLMGQGYGSPEIARRLGVSSSAVYGFAHRIYSRICTDEQRDGRRPAWVVMCWAARNLETLQGLIQSERDAQWHDLPDAVTEHPHRPVKIA